MKKAPKLRFKEFSGDWEDKKLGVITTKVGSGKTPKGGNSVYTDSGIIFLRSQNVLNGKLNLNDVAYIPEEINSTMKSTEVQGHDILLNITGASIGRSCNVPKDFPRANVNQHVCIIRLNESYNSDFIMNQIISSKVQKQIDSYQAGGNREGLNFEQIKSMKVSSTSIKEQEKIASFFSLIDNKISLQGEKVEALKDYKKGMMQKIFIRELRFKDDDGVDYPEWKEKRLGEVLTSRIEKQVPSQETPLMSFTAKGGIEPKGDKYDRSFLVKSDQKLYKRTELNDFIYSSNNLDVGSIGLNRYGTAVISDVYEIFIISKEASCNFISELLQTPKVMNKILRYRQGVMYGQYRIHADEFLKIKEFMPCLEEQNKIENFISSIDDKINKEQEKLDYLNEYKKGLLQQMFI